MPQVRYPTEEIARRGEEIYQQDLRARVEPDHRGKFLVLDVDTRDYEIDAEELPAVNALRRRRPEGTFYLIRIGSPAAVRLGRHAGAP